MSADEKNVIGFALSGLLYTPYRFDDKLMVGKLDIILFEH